MGGKYFDYIGVYLDMRLRKYKHHENIKICPDHREIKGNELFCSQCGNKIIDKIKTSIQWNTYYDIIGDNFADVLVPTNTESEEGQKILIKNTAGHYDIDGTGYLEIKDNHQNVIETFKKQYDDILEYFNNHKQVMSVNVKFGYVRWYC